MSPVIVLILLISTMSCCAAPSPGNDHCQKPDPVDGAQLQGEWNEETYPPGKVANFACPPGYIQDGPIKMACIEGTWWQIAKGQCKVPPCGPPPVVRNARMNGPNKDSYESGEKVIYSCNSGYSLVGSGELLCKNTIWVNLPLCKRLGSECGPPPHVQYGDTLGIQKSSYKSGESVTYKCPQYYILNGDINVQCLHGVWGEAPECLEPCTANERVMKQYNLELRWTSDKKLYSLHDDLVEFRCTFGYEVLPDTQMRVRCERGMLEYPKCYKKGFCVLEQLRMMANNITYNISTVVDDGETILFQCNEGTIPENQLDAKCENKNINYPRCASAKYSCDEAPEVQNATVTEKKKIYFHGERVKYTCERGFRFSGNDSAICIKRKWIEIPLCVVTSCGPPPVVPNSKINGPTKESYESGEKVPFSCNIGYTLGASEEALCRNTIWMNLPVCRRTGASCGPPPIVQYGDILEIQKTLYKSGEFVTYKCPEYYILQGDSKVKCLHGVWGEEPECIEPCTARERDMKQNNIQLRWRTDNKLYLPHGDSTEFQCKSGYKALRDTQMRVRCERGKLEYPKCFKIA